VNISELNLEANVLNCLSESSPQAAITASGSANPAAQAPCLRAGHTIESQTHKIHFNHILNLSHVLVQEAKTHLKLSLVCFWKIFASLPNHLLFKESITSFQTSHTVFQTRIWNIFSGCLSISWSISVLLNTLPLFLNSGAFVCLLNV
jgi:hypothetical protein